MSGVAVVLPHSSRRGGEQLLQKNCGFFLFASRAEQNDWPLAWTLGLRCFGTQDVRLRGTKLPHALSLISVSFLSRHACAACARTLVVLLLLFMISPTYWCKLPPLQQHAQQQQPSSFRITGSVLSCVIHHQFMLVVVMLMLVVVMRPIQ